MPKLLDKVFAQDPYKEYFGVGDFAVCTFNANDKTTLCVGTDGEFATLSLEDVIKTRDALNAWLEETAT